MVELRFDGDYVIGYDNLTDSNGDPDPDKFYNGDEYKQDAIDDESVYYVVLNDSDAGELSLQGRTLYALADQADYGLTFTREAKAVVIQEEYNKTVKTLCLCR